MEDKWFEKIEDYLNGKMDNEEKALFEKALASDKELASVFNVYRTIESDMQANENERFDLNKNALKQSLEALNEKYFESEQDESLQPVKTFNLYRFLTTIAASVMVVLVAYFIVSQVVQSPQNLARRYIGAHLMELQGQQLDASQDSLEIGIQAYNNEDYEKALICFQDVYKRNPGITEAKKNIGLVYLATKQYDKAIVEFDQLIAMPELYTNPGRFLKALTLMRRNKKGDKEEARQLLEQVVREKSEGYEEAQEWLKKVY